MKYGIENEGEKVLCANCKKVIDGGELNQNYCLNCGAPLSPMAIGEFEEMLSNYSNQVITQLKKIAVTNKTDKFSQIISVFEEE